jgi:hypothetical protein
MKRCITLLALVSAAAISMAQAPFTIVRPVDNARVREDVRVLLPKGSIPPGGYVGIFLNDRFVEALVPPVRGQYHEYILNTKARGLPDGPAKLEMVLYVDYQDQPRIADRSSVNITIGNQANIPIPEGGIRLRYNWRPGTQLVYGVMQRMVVSTISEAQNQLGGRAAEFPTEFEKIRLSYGVENAYGDGDGLVRLQPLPLMNKNYAVLTVAGDSEPKRYFDYMMAPIYMRVSNTGRERWATIPPFVPMEGTVGEVSRLDLYAAFPLPSLPERPVRPGSTWASRFQMGSLDLENIYDLSSVTATMPARGEFVRTEWEMGHPCARIQNTISVGVSSEQGRRLAAMGATFAEDSKFTIDETIWFALDRRQVIKIVRNFTIDHRADGVGAAGAAMGGPAGGPAGGPSPSGGPFGPGGGGRAMGGDDRQMVPGALGGASQPGRAPAGETFVGGAAGARGGAPAGGGQFVRTRIQQIFVLEK